ncbi:isoprenylcysteine carboxylmethyltransferase family protein [Candidatus Microgenomates bacterium]|nr:isoprenylcysteine carboxylmethyltransferase family protein [Candidatus Microgenomates bacterium]
MGRLTRITPPTYLFIYIVVTVVLVLLFPFLKIIYPPYTYLGVPLIILGLCLTFWVDWLLKKKKTAVKPLESPSVLIAEGIFRLSRHPMYLGFVFWLLGLAILSGNLMAFVAPMAMFITFEKVFIPYEEKILEEIFGEKYRNYKKRARKWL